MGQARELMDRVTDAIVGKKDLKAVEACYAPDAVALTPDQGEIRGQEQIAQYLGQFVEAFPDAQYEYIAQHESGDAAIDEGYFVGVNTGPLTLPTGETLPATGKQIRMPSCDVAVVANGVITQHRFYYDQMALLEQLGLAEAPPA